MLFDNTDIMADLSSLNDIDTVRETLVTSMLAPFHELNAPAASNPSWMKNICSR